MAAAKIISHRAGSGHDVSVRGSKRGLREMGDAWGKYAQVQ